MRTPDEPLPHPGGDRRWRQDEGAVHPLVDAYRAHERRVLAVCQQLLRDHADAEDATQEVFLRAAPHLHEFSGNLGAYLVVVARNVCLDELRRRPRRRRLSLEVRPQAGSDTEDRALDRSSLLHTWRRLTQAERELLLQSYAGYSYDEIGRRTGMSVEAVRLALFRARQRARWLSGRVAVALTFPRTVMRPIRSARPAPMRGVGIGRHARVAVPSVRARAGWFAALGAIAMGLSVARPLPTGGGADAGGSGPQTTGLAPAGSGPVAARSTTGPATAAPTAGAHRGDTLPTPAPGSADHSYVVPCSGQDGGASGLRDAITSADAAGGGTITLASGCTYTLPGADHTDSSGGNGLPAIIVPITITAAPAVSPPGMDTGVGGQSTTITRSGNGPAFRILEVTGNGSLDLRDIAVSGGVAPTGGGIRGAGTRLTLTNVQLSGNTASATGAAHGGGVECLRGTLEITNSQITQNQANGATASGGGVYSAAGVVLTNSQVAGNSAQAGAGSAQGGGVWSGGPVTLENSQVETDSAQGTGVSGGGVYSGGGVGLTNSQVENNTAAGGTGPALGGGIYSHSGLQMENSQVTGNQLSGRTATGGGVYSGATVAGSNSQVSSNSPNDTATASGPH